MNKNNKNRASNRRIKALVYMKKYASAFFGMDYVSNRQAIFIGKTEDIKRELVNGKQNLYS